MKSLAKILMLSGILMSVVLVGPIRAADYDIRGVWVGNAKGSIFSAKGSVTITSQRGEEIEAIVEGGNIFGKAKFQVRGTLRGNFISGALEGNSFQGYIYPDWSIRGVFKGVDGDSYQVFLQRPYNYYWGMPQQGWPYN